MVKMNFEDKTLERMMRSFKWARNNSLQILESARKHDIMNYRPGGDSQHTMLYQFQCLVTTTDTYYRKLTNHEDKRFGVLIREAIVQKDEIREQDLKALLARQIVELEDLFMNFTTSDLEMNVQDIQSIINHEYLHQGQLVVMFRGLGISLPERFRLAFDL